MKKFLAAHKTAFVRLGVTVVLLGITYGFVAFLLPLPEEFYEPVQYDTTKIYDREGVLLYEIFQPGEGKKTVIPLDKIPDRMKQATLAAEDINFYEHGGVDVGAIFRAVFLNVKEGRIVSGGSTITQQLVRNMLGTQQKRTIDNKVMELLYAVRVSHLYSKDQVFELYLNKIYYGNLAYGVESAALDYFGKHVYDLDLAESALLAGLPQSPSFYNPFSNFKRAKARQGYVLDQMAKYGFISEEEAKEAKEAKLVFRRNRVEIKAPHFVHRVIGELEEEFGERLVHYGGLQVKTTLDYNMQARAEDIIDRNLERLTKEKVGNGALIALDVRTNEVKTWVGSRNYFDEDIDGAVDMITALRQPGSSIKPFTYLAALEKGWTPATTVSDIPTQFSTTTGPYTPKNYDLKFHGLVRLRTALASSYNVPAVKVLEYVGVADFMHFLKKLRIDSLTRGPEFYGLALTLGGGEVRPLAMAQGFGTLARGGEAMEVRTILEVKQGEEVLKTMPDKVDREYVLGPEGRQHAYQIIDILKDPNARIPGFGEGSVLELSRPAAVKTGTTRNFRDNWTIGFTPQLLTAVWVGNADGAPMSNVSGVDGAGPIWHDFMEQILRTEPRMKFVKPSRLKEVEICALSGKLPTDECPDRVYELFVAGTEPREMDDVFQKMKVSEDGEMIVSEACLKVRPDLKFREVVFEVYPLELQEWALKKGIPQPPRVRCEDRFGIEVVEGDAGVEVIQKAMITHPLEGDSFLLDASIPKANQMVSLKIAVPSGVDRVEWVVGGETVAVSEEFPFKAMWEPQVGQWAVEARVFEGEEMVDVVGVGFEVRG